MSSVYRSHGLTVIVDMFHDSNRYLVQIGAYGETKLLVLANSEDDALEAAAEWCEENAPGHLANDAVCEEYERAIADGLSEEEARDRAEVDTIALDQGRYLLSWEVSVHRASREDILLAQERAR